MNLTKLLDVQMLSTNEQSKNINLIVTNALIFVVENHFRQLGSYFVLTYMCRERFFCHYYNDLLDNLFLSWEPLPMQVINILPNHTQSVPGTRDINLLFVDTFESFSSIDVVSHTSRYDHNEYYYIFLQNFDHLLSAEMSKIFDYCWKNYMINCNVQIQNAKGEILVYTYYPYTPGNCSNITIRLINQFKHKTMLYATLYPEKLSNFHRCSLRAAVWDVPPFIYLKEFANGIGYITRGAEGRLLKEMSDRLNFTVIVKVPPNDEQRGSSNPKNLTGALRMLHDRTADFSLGCFRFSQDRAEVATATASFYQSVQVICIPVVAYRFSSLEILLFPFSNSVWQLLLMILSCAISIIWLQKRYSLISLKETKIRKGNISKPGQDHAFLNMYLMALGMSVTIMPRRDFTRLLCLNWIFLTLLLRTSYQAFLFHFMRTQPLRALPMSVDDLVAQNYTIALNLNTYGALKDVKFISHLNLHTINSTSETISFEYAGKQADRKLVAAGPSAFMLYYKYKARIANDFQLLKQNIYSMPITMYLTKHSFLVDQFNDMLLRFRSAGLTQKWFQQEVDFGYVSKLTTEVRFFQLEDLYMLFGILMLGHGLAVIAFLLEFSYAKLTT